MGELTKLTIAGARDALRKGETTSAELTEACLAAIEGAGALNAFVHDTPEIARAQAAAADARIKAGDAPDMCGIPLGIKDLFCTKGVASQAASRILEGFSPEYESTVTSKLFDAGSVMLGKLNMDEFAMGSSNETSVYGNAVNPWQGAGGKALTPGGSSGGSAAAVAADLCLAAPAIGRRIARILGQNGGEGLRGIGRSALGQHLLGGGNRLAQPAIAGQVAEPLDEGLDLGARHRALEAVDRLALVEGIDGRDRLHAQLPGDHLVLVDIDLDHLDLAAGRGDLGLQHRAQGLARAAPGRPEIDDDRDFLAGLDHVGHEGRLGNVLDEIARSSGRRVGFRAEFKHWWSPASRCRKLYAQNAARVQGPVRADFPLPAQRSMRASTGAWSEGCSQPRTSRRISLPPIEGARSAVAQTWSSLRPLSAADQSRAR